VLEGDSRLSDLGIDTVLIGSYARNVSIRRMHDVDVFSELKATAKDTQQPSALLDIFSGVLVAAFGQTRVRRQRRSMQIDFPDFDLHVDAVPAIPDGSQWLIPDGPARWQSTNPIKLGEITSEMNSRFRLGGRGVYVPVVKLVRQTRQAGAIERPGGLYFEVLTYWAFQNGSVSGASVGEFYTTALSGVALELRKARAGGLVDPALPSQLITTKATVTDLDAALNEIERVAGTAEAALDSDDECQAARNFRVILGANDDGPVFPMPAHCAEDGSRLEAAVHIVPGERRVPAGDDKFA
jgi:hypothetical protein